MPPDPLVAPVTAIVVLLVAPTGAEDLLLHHLEGLARSDVRDNNAPFVALELLPDGERSGLELLLHDIPLTGIGAGFLPHRAHQHVVLLMYPVQ
jgi:hypothetical protein